MAKLQNVRGTYDLYGEAKRKMKKVTSVGSEVVEKYGFEEIETPIFEFTEVFSRNLGETSDVVTKEMYCFEDRGGESLTLRPEGTAGVVRSFVSEGMQQNLPVKLYYSGPMFRYERPQKGRQRQFTQFGCELLGVETPQADIEVIAMAYEFLEKLGLTGSVTVEINSLGDRESRDAYREKLVAYLKSRYDELSEDSKTRLERNPLRVLDSKEECDKAVVEDAPLYKDSLNEASSAFFNAVLKGLDNLGIKYKVNDRLVRGLDYYSHTVFELVTDKLGSQGTVLAGGRYDGLLAKEGIEGQAAGFALNLKELAAHCASPAPAPLMMLWGGGCDNSEALRYADALSKKDTAFELSWTKNREESLSTASLRGYKWWIDLGGRKVTLLPRGGEISLNKFESEVLSC